MPYLGNEVAPLVQALEGKELKLDSDGDSSIQASTDDTVVFKTNGSNRWTLNSSGNLFPASTSQGIVFGATSDTSANRLDDYEEGTWTPGILNGWGVTSPTYSQNTGFYTKIGNVCHVSFRITLSGGSFNSNRLTVQGFPFTAGSNTSDTIHTINGFFDTASSNAENVFLKVVDNGVYPSFHARTASGISAFTGSNADTAFNLCFSGSYFTT